VTRLPALLLALLALARPHPALAQGGDIIERDTVVTTGEIKLPATLTLPAGAARAPAVVLVHGSGPNDRDETVGANKPFRDLAHGLARKGIVVIRYEKRSRAAPLSFMGRRFTVDDEVVDDALSLVILAGATRPLTDMIEAQFAYLRSLPGADTAAIDKALAGMAPGLAAVRALTPADSAAKNVFFGAPAAYWLDLAGYDPVRVAGTLRMPILILQGGRDYQVTNADLAGWRAGLGKRANVRIVEYPTLNHLFIAGSGLSSPAEYGVAGSVDGQVIADIADWILALPLR
jgi:dienelactone hydrolase